MAAPAAVYRPRNPQYPDFQDAPVPSPVSRGAGSIMTAGSGGASLGDRVSFALSIPNYDDWPYKIIYASDGISVESLLGHLNNYYHSNPNIPLGRRPNIIHVSGK